MKRYVFTIALLATFALPAQAQQDVRSGVTYGLAPSFVMSGNSASGHVGIGGKFIRYNAERQLGVMAEVDYTPASQSEQGAITWYRRTDALAGVMFGSELAPSGLWYVAPKAGLVQTYVEGGSGTSLSGQALGMGLGLSAGTIDTRVFFDFGMIFIPSQKLSIDGVSMEGLAVDAGALVAATLTLGFTF